ncbi:MAG: peptide ABC transporter substrate-binding protein [Microbacterium sp.]|uniref:peptide ABC transporter substrate-binding protein n=1 Tax=Microbacterium sp. TaxID=51671 RepID=UPI003F95F780
MKRNKIALAGVGLLTAGTLALTACSGGNGAPEGGDVAADESAIITTNGTEPQKPLIPYDTTEVGGGRIVESLFAGLVSYTKDGEVENEIAESIESDDATTWTITLKDGWTFTDDEEITAQTFVDTWTQAAMDPAGTYWFQNIEGVSEDGSTEPTGLKVVDDKTFTVTLKSPESEFPIRLGYSAYVPLPSTAFDDLAAFGENPVGNGPYMLEEEGAWRHNEGISLVTNPDYEGNRTPANGGLEFVFYTDLNAAYTDVQSGNLDVLDEVSDTHLATFETEFEGRFVNQPAALNATFNVPFYLPHFADDEEGQLRRAAISMAVNRDEIAETIFSGAVTPASDFTSPTLDGWSDSLEGAGVLEYNPEEAEKLWAEAEAIAPYTGTFDIAYNSDGGHQAWVDAVANSISNTLGIQAEGKPYPTFQAALDDRMNQQLTGATRAGWQGDFPSLGNFLSPLYTTGGSSNYEGYTNEEFDAKIDEAAAASSLEEGIALYNESQEMLLQDLPAIPLWYENAVGVWSEDVDNVVFGWNRVPLYYDITKG